MTIVVEKLQRADSQEVIRVKDEQKNEQQMDRLTQIVSKFEQLHNELNSVFVQRQQQIEDMLLALICREHCLFLGPPGTAKSMLIRALTSAIENCRYFEYLLNRTTDPAAIVGPYSLKMLEQDRFARCYEGYLPTADIVFLDEIYKANEPVLNILLPILNERKFHNDGQVITVPLISAFFASNEGPEDDSLQALHDRILFRSIVNYISDTNDFISMLTGNAADFKPSVTFARQELDYVYNLLPQVEIPENIFLSLVRLRQLLMADDVIISDRRWVACLKVLRASALRNGRMRVAPYDLKTLSSILWQYEDQIPIVNKHIATVIDPYTAEFDRIQDNLYSILDEATELLYQCGNDKIKWMQVTVDTVSRIAGVYQKLVSTVKSAEKEFADDDTLAVLGKRLQQVKFSIDNFLSQHSIPANILENQLRNMGALFQ